LANITIEELLEAGVHFGHQTNRWNPKIKKFIFDARNGIYIIDLNKTLIQIQVACGFLHDVVLNNGKVLFIGTKKQAQQQIRDVGSRTGMPHIVDRWLGGTLTNLSTIRNSVKRMNEIDRIIDDADANRLKKKEVARLKREQFRLHRNLDGIANMEEPPDAVFIVDIMREQIAVKEAQRLKIPIVAIVDTNCDPDLATHPIAGNDDAIRSIKLITRTIGDAILEAQAELGKQIEEAKAAEEAEAEAANQETEPAQPTEPTEPTEPAVSTN